MNRRDFTRLAGAAAAAASVPGLGQGAGQAGPSATVQVTVNPAKRLGRLPAYGLGFSAEKHQVGMQTYFVEENADFTGLCKRLGPQVLRVGGTHVDHNAWNLNGPGKQKGTTAPPDIARFAAYVKTLGWKVVYGLNLAHQTPQENAEEARYAAQDLGSSLLAFEIGNEPNIFVAHDDRPKGYDYKQYLSEFLEHANAIRAAVPNAPLSGPGAYGAWKMNGVQFAKDMGPRLQMLTEHYYRMSGKAPEATLNALFDGLPELFETMTALVAAARANHIPDGFRMIETNSFVGGGLPGVSDRMAAAVWAVEYILRAAEIGVNGLNFQIGSVEAMPSNSPFLLGPGSSVSAIRPEFYALAMMADLGAGTMLETTLRGAPARVSAFCLEGPGGAQNFVLNNMTDNAALAVEVHFTQAGERAETMALTGGSLAAATCTLGGAAFDVSGKGEARWSAVKGKAGVFMMRLPPASAVRVRLAA